MKNSIYLFRGLFFILVFSAIIVSALTLYSQSIRLDEAQQLWQSTKSVPTIITVISEDVHVPVYTLIMHFWLQFFGTNISVARTLSFIFFILTIPALYKVAKESANEKIALLSITLFSLSPFITWYSNEARTYTLFTFITCVNHLYFLRLLRSNGRNGRFGYFLSSFVGFYTHYFFLLLIASQLMFIFTRFYSFFMEKREEFVNPLIPLWHNNKRFIISYSVSLGSAMLLFLPWVSYILISGSYSNSQPIIPPPTSYNIFQTFVNFLFGFQSQGIQGALISLWPLIVLFFFFIFTQKKHVQIHYLGYFGLVTFLPIALVFIGSYFRPIFLSRYLILVTPTFFLLLAWILLSYSKKVSILITSTLIIIMYGLMVFQNISSFTPVKEDYKDVALFLSQNATPQDIIAVSAPFTIYPIEYSYTGNTKIATIPDWDRYNQPTIPAFSEQNLIKQINNYKKSYENIIVVLSYDQGYEKKIRSYLDKNYALKKIKKFSQGLEIREYILRYK